MAEQLSAAEWAKKIANEYRKGPVLPYDLEQWIILAVTHAEKQAGAEVLAACVARLRAVFRQAADTSSNNSQFITEAELLQALRSVQPTAYLEELLEIARRETELKALKLAHNSGACIRPWDCPAAVRIAELEKARAEGKR